MVGLVTNHSNRHADLVRDNYRLLSLSLSLFLFLYITALVPFLVS